MKKVTVVIEKIVHVALSYEVDEEEYKEIREIGRFPRYTDAVAQAHKKEAAGEPDVDIEYDYAVFEENDNCLIEWDD